MPFTLNGCGTKYYGRREMSPDGSYITTEWIVLAYIPLIPVGSFQVLPTGESSYYIVGRSTKYFVKRVPFNLKQIRNTYITVIGIFGALSVGLSLIGQSSSKTYTPTKSSQITISHKIDS
jgi:hypothetical protein